MSEINTEKHLNGIKQAHREGNMVVAVVLDDVHRLSATGPLKQRIGDVFKDHYKLVGITSPEETALILNLSKFDNHKLGWAFFLSTKEPIDSIHSLIDYFTVNVSPWPGMKVPDVVLNEDGSKLVGKGATLDHAAYQQMADLKMEFVLKAKFLAVYMEQPTVHFGNPHIEL